MKRYKPKHQFAVYVDGTPRVFKPDYIDPATGMQGYETLPKGLSKDQKASFDVIEVGPPVEQATAAPGEKRTRKPKAKAQTVGVEQATDEPTAK